MSINIEKLLYDGKSIKRLPENPGIRKIFLLILNKILYVKKINSFIEKHHYLNVRQFINELFDELNFAYSISNRDIQKIPSEGRVICVANHPIGSLDALALLKTILEIRRDVKVVANELLCSIGKLDDYIIPIKLDYAFAQRYTIEAIRNSLNAENAVIIFPAASVSRLKGITITDSKWNKGAVHFAKKLNAPILPVFIEARNSLLFYIVSIISKKLSMFLLPHELFNKKNKIINIKIGDLIPSKAFTASLIDESQQIKLLRRHVGMVGKGKKGIYATEKNVIHPGERKIIKKELSNAQLLSVTKDGLKIYFTTRTESPETLNEIARLREITFRKVGEGTGKKFDLDKYDDHYNHLIVWDDNELEIVGSYRVGLGSDILKKHGVNGFYTSTLFNFSNEMQLNFLSESLELGRSFVQKKYWNTNALNYLWQGIGAYLVNNPSVKYLFGGVSISNSYPISIQEPIVYYFSKWFAAKTFLAESKRKFIIPEKNRKEFEKCFNGTNIKEDYKILKNMIKPAGYSVPILYKHYSDLCDEGGVSFLDFGVDPDFENCVDGLILVDVEMIRDEKRQKFMRENWNERLKATA